MTIKKKVKSDNKSIIKVKKYKKLKKLSNKKNTKFLSKKKKLVRGGNFNNDIYIEIAGPQPQTKQPIISEHVYGDTEPPNYDFVSSTNRTNMRQRQHSYNVVSRPRPDQTNEPIYNVVKEHPLPTPPPVLPPRNKSLPSTVSALTTKNPKLDHYSSLNPLTRNPDTGKINPDPVVNASLFNKLGSSINRIAGKITSVAAHFDLDGSNFIQQCRSIYNRGDPGKSSQIEHKKYRICNEFFKQNASLIIDTSTDPEKVVLIDSENQELNINTFDADIEQLINHIVSRLSLEEISPQKKKEKGVGFNNNNAEINTKPPNPDQAAKITALEAQVKQLQQDFKQKEAEASEAQAIAATTPTQAAETVVEQKNKELQSIKEQLANLYGIIYGMTTRLPPEFSMLQQPSMAPHITFGNIGTGNIGTQTPPIDLEEIRELLQSLRTPQASTINISALQTAQDTISKLEAHIAGLTRSMDTLIAQKTTPTTPTNATNKERLEEQLRSLASIKSEEEGVLADLRAQIAVLSGRVGGVEGRIGGVEHRVTKTEGNVSDINSRLTTVESQIKTLMGKYQTAVDSIEENKSYFQLNFDGILEKIGKLESKVTQSTQNKEAEIAAIREDIASEFKTIEREMMEALDTRQAEIERASAIKSNVEEEIKKLNLAVEILKAQKLNKTDFIEFQQKYLREMEAKAQLIATNRKDLLEKEAVLQGEIDKLRALINRPSTTVASTAVKAMAASTGNPDSLVTLFSLNQDNVTSNGKQPFEGQKQEITKEFINNKIITTKTYRGNLTRVIDFEQFKNVIQSAKLYNPEDSYLKSLAYKEAELLDALKQIKAKFLTGPNKSLPILNGELLIRE
jgi:hypothetical protein